MAARSLHAHIDEGVSGGDALGAPASPLASGTRLAPERPALVLLVDDDPGTFELVSQALDGQPLDLAVVSDGETALERVRLDRPDLVLLDAAMPGMDGFEVCRRLKADPATHEIPILLMTELADPASRARAFEAGAAEQVTRPLVREELAARVRTQLTVRAAWRALSVMNDELARAHAALEPELARRTEELRAEIRRLQRKIKQSQAAEGEVQRAREQLAQRNQVSAMRALAASLAHELNQPLAAILSNAQAAERLLGRIPPDVAEARAALDDIVADDRRAARVIQRMRAMLREGEPTAAALDLNALVREADRLMAGAALVAGTTVRLELAPGLPRVQGDGVQLQQVLVHLLANALDAVACRPPAARLVVVRTRRADGGRVELSVADSGDGVPPADLERVFEPFFTSKPRGLGVGLAISRSIVEAHGGRLWAEHCPGEGATFRCALPVLDEEGRPAG
ncbi:hybrid sensor histidine kinase/response regulator [Sorangium sp. So ce1099]|uniref:hybrid sensor histidine kinase/response regulator n=1 Tax=Sorangium sp. So ce1099 TaxID=3133331 RepID=UPI003F62093E